MELLHILQLELDTLNAFKNFKDLRTPSILETLFFQILYHIQLLNINMFKYKPQCFCLNESQLQNSFYFLKHTQSCSVKIFDMLWKGQCATDPLYSTKTVMRLQTLVLISDGLSIFNLECRNGEIIMEANILLSWIRLKPHLLSSKPFEVPSLCVIQIIKLKRFNVVLF